jgi:hypothetical protein
MGGARTSQQALCLLAFLLGALPVFTFDLWCAKMSAINRARPWLIVLPPSIKTVPWPLASPAREVVTTGIRPNDNLEVCKRSVSVRLRHVED